VHERIDKRLHTQISKYPQQFPKNQNYKLERLVSQ